MRTPLRLLLLSCLALVATGCDDGLLECPSDNVTCGGTCTDLLVDRQNCGACGTVCNAGFECVEGSCVCPEGETPCGGVCTRLPIDPRNCGACGNICGAGEVCIDGACAPGSCPGIVCEVEGESVCVADPATDEQHCGACGNACAAGTECLGGVCAVGDLYAACYASGTVVPLRKATETPSSPIVQGNIDGPQSLALYDGRFLLAVGGGDGLLWIYDRATMQPIDSVLVGSVPNQVVVRGDRAYVVASGEHVVTVVDLGDPADLRVVDQVSTGAGSNPWAGAFDEAGTFWVATYVAETLVPVDFSGATGVAGTPIALPTQAIEGAAFPSGVAVAGGKVYVSYPNLDPGTWRPAGNGRLAVHDPAQGTTTLVDLGSGCTNPGLLTASGPTLYVACGGSFDLLDGSVAIFDTATGTVTSVIATGGSPNHVVEDPARPGHLYAGNSGGLGFFSIDPEGNVASVDVCTVPGEIGWEYNSDVLVAP